MSKYQEFCESLRVGRAGAEEEQFVREDEERRLPQAVGDVLRRMCDYFQCPAGQVRYVDTQGNLVTGALQGGMPPLRYSPQKGRECLDLEIGVGAGPGQAPYPVWIHLEWVPLKHGGLEAHFGPATFRVPDEERAFFDHVAAAINRELRQGCTAGPRRIGC